MVSPHAENLVLVNLPKTINIEFFFKKDSALFKSNFSLQDKYDRIYYYSSV